MRDQESLDGGAPASTTPRSVQGEPRAVVTKRSLFAFLPAQALLQQFDAGYIAHPTSKDELLEAWESARKELAKLGPSSRSFFTPADYRDLVGVPSDSVEELVRRLKSYSPFDSHPTAVRVVRVAKLVTPQLMVNMARLERRASLKRDLTDQELFGVSFEAGRNPEPVVRQTLGMAPNGGSLMFTSYDEDIRLHQPPMFRKLSISEKDRRSTELESICFPVGGGTPFAYAFKVELLPGVQRLILANGIHRAAAAALAGVEWLPLAVCDLTAMELPDQFVDTPKPMLLDPGFNAPTIADFTREGVVINLDYYRQLRTVRFNWNFENYAVGLR